MVRELNHRVKNTLAVVQAIAAQTIRPTGDPAEMVQRFSARIAALARTHDLLTTKQWDVVDLSELIGKELAHLATGARVGVAGPVVRLPPETALSIGLILHELATNAMKYGSLSVPEGSVRIAWRLEDAAENKACVQLTWTEQGGPQPTEPPARSGFGSRLIAQVSRSIGSSEISFPPEGVRFTLTFSIPRQEDEAPAVAILA